MDDSPDPEVPREPHPRPHGPAEHALANRLEEAPDITVVFDLVKEAVERHLGRSRAGIMVGLADLGVGPSSFLGGYFQVGTNAIVLNGTVLRNVRLRAPDVENAYLFHILLHEYLHTLGYLREDQVRPLALEVSRELLGPQHPATLLAAALAGTRDLPEAMALFRKLAFSPVAWRPDDHRPMTIVKGIDHDATPYIM